MTFFKFCGFITQYSLYFPAPSSPHRVRLRPGGGLLKKEQERAKERKEEEFVQCTYRE
jgi:hypothetical protein